MQSSHKAVSPGAARNRAHRLSHLRLQSGLKLTVKRGCIDYAEYSGWKKSKATNAREFGESIAIGKYGQHHAVSRLDERNALHRCKEAKDVQCIASRFS